MPLFYQHNINEFSRLGIWKIEEEEDFFLEKVFLQREISHPHKRLQHLAARYLLQLLFSDFPYDLVMIAETRKPFLSNEAYHFSISHCGDFASAIVSKINRVGVDIEIVKPIIQKIQRKFLGEEELRLLPDVAMMVAKAIAAGDTVRPEDVSSYFLTLCWSAKEAIYKWFGNGGLDFKTHMQLAAPFDFYYTGPIELFYIFSKEEQVQLTVRCQFFDDLVLSYVIS